MTDTQRKKRIIFVDDESKVLSGLLRMLHFMRKEWDMTFATNGFDALEIMKKQAFDVIVSDMRMPGMDGADIFREGQTGNPLENVLFPFSSVIINV